MGKIEELSLEIKKYNKSYSDILVGMHNDLTKYKKDVTIQKANTEEALKSFRMNLSQIEQMKKDSLASINQIKDFNKSIKESESSVNQSLAVFEKEKTLFLNKLSSFEDSFLSKINENSIKLSEQITSVEKELNSKIVEKSIKISERLTTVEKELNFKISENSNKFSKKLTSIEQELNSKINENNIQFSEELTAVKQELNDKINESNTIINKRQKAIHKKNIIAYVLLILSVLYLYYKVL